MSEQTHQPCPFCGGAPKRLSMGHLSWAIGCPDCGSTTGSYGTEAEAWAAWNRRADPARDALLAACRAVALAYRGSGEITELFAAAEACEAAVAGVKGEGETKGVGQ